MNFQQFILVLKARWKTVMSVLATIVALALIISLLLPHEYSGETSIVVDMNSPDPVTQQMMPAQLSTDYLTTQINILQSPRVAREVARRLHLDQSPDMQEQWRQDTNGRGDFFVWAGDKLDKNLDVEPVKDSNVINVSYLGRSAQLAATIANSFADVYMSTNAELVSDPAKNYSTWFQNQTRALRQTLEDAQNKLAEFQRAHGIVGTEDQTDVETARLQDLSQQLAQAQALQSDASAREGGALRDADDLPEVLQNPVITNLKTQIALQEAQLQQLASNLGTQHPTYIQAAANLTALKQREAAEVRRVVGSIGSADRTSHTRVADLRAALEAQKQKVLQLREARDQASVLQGDVTTAQRDYDAVTQRLAQASLESRMQLSQLSVLTPAVAPLFPSRPRLTLNTAIAILLGGLLGVGVALWQEMSDQRVRSPEQLALLAGVPVLGIIPRRSDRKRRYTWLPPPQHVLPALESK